MGRNAKFCKRVKKGPSVSASQTTPKAAASHPKQSTSGNDAATSVQAAKKRTILKGKAKSKSSARQDQDAGSGGHVLGGADYVTLLMGGRKKAAEEARKLPKDTS
ncbi:hypothetical protein BV22DRAFT_1073879 [Leucogyrophana mollusca]|uniref:Uncharacterized protein n=1 Tax=Leucogyrophana mollusca TaxID=85980 RepID=A0ACB8B4Y4_9AGAM|nr:hypothetical protein BV22DRAFT_1073879 [Leucogyrophana mollusca]